MALNQPAFESNESTDAVVDNASAASAASAAPAAPAAADGGTAAPAVADAPAAATVGVTGEQAAQGEVALVNKGTALAAPKVQGNKSAAQLMLEADHLATLSGQMPVSWEMFETINATQGQFQAKGEKLMLGTEIEVHVVSTQPLTVSSNGDTEAEGEGLMLYSDDGVNANADSTVFDAHVEWLRSKGIADRELLTVKEHQQWLKENDHDKAHVQQKLTIVGELTKCGDQGMPLLGTLVQVSLPDTGRRSYESHCKQSAYHIYHDRMNKVDVEYIKLTAKQAGSGKKLFTQVKVGYADGRGAKLN